MPDLATLKPVLAWGDSESTDIGVFLRVIYSSLFLLFSPLLLLRLWRRGKVSPAYRERISERFFVKVKPKAPVLWVHSVSLGETIASRPLVEHLLKNYPHHQVLVTCMTPTGSAQAIKQYGDRVLHQYLPYDLPFFISLFVKRINPQLLLIVETEIWPNLLHSCRKNGTKVMLANARLSQKSLTGYKRLGQFASQSVQCFNLIAAQHLADKTRFEQLGALGENVRVTGSVKYDATLDNVQLNQGRAVKASINRFTIVAASTHEGEEQMLIKAFEKLRDKYPELNPLMVLVPRHPERFESIKALIQKQKFSFGQRSKGESIDQDRQLYLGDSMGEMSFYYALADLAFVGGSLVPVGGHNPLEPASIGLPVLVGPYVRNFETICEEMVKLELLKTVNDESELLAALEKYKNSVFDKKASLIFVESKRGAVDAQCRLIDELINEK